MRTINDSQTIRACEVEEIVRKLCVSYAHLRRVFFSHYSCINQQLNEGDVTGAVKTLIDVYKLPQGFTRRVGFRVRGLPNEALAVMRMDLKFPEMVPVCADLLFRYPKEEVLAMPRYRLIHIIAHELTHARMFLDQHALAHSEFATDVVALMVTGDAKGHCENMSHFLGYYGYIRSDLYDEVFRCLGSYAERMYLASA